MGNRCPHRQLAVCHSQITDRNWPPYLCQAQKVSRVAPMFAYHLAQQLWERMSSEKGKKGQMHTPRVLFQSWPIKQITFLLWKGICTCSRKDQDILEYFFLLGNKAEMPWWNWGQGSGFMTTAPWLGSHSLLLGDTYPTLLLGQCWPVLQAYMPSFPWHLSWPTLYLQQGGFHMLLELTLSIHVSPPPPPIHMTNCQFWGQALSFMYLCI